MIVPDQQLEKARQLREEASELRYEADSLDREADTLEANFEALKKRADQTLSGVLQNLLAAAIESGITWFERCAIEAAISNPWDLAPMQRERVVHHARLCLGIDLPLPPPVR